MKTSSPATALAALTVLAVPALQAQTLFYAALDSAADAANWTVFTSSADTEAIFGYDYSADGIPPAPNSAGGTTIGVKFTANNLDAVAAAAGLSISPNGQFFTGDYELRYDLWMNANGPFPAGGTGSTEFASVAIGLAAPALVWSGAAPANVPWFAVSGEGGAAQDFRAHVRGIAQFTPASGVFVAGTDANARDHGHPYYTSRFPGQQPPPGQQAANPTVQTGTAADGTIGFAWRQVTVTKVGTVVEWSIDGTPIVSLDAGLYPDVRTEGNIALGYFDPFNSISANPEFSFAIVDNVLITVVPEPGVAALALLGAGVLALRRRR